MVVKNKKIGVVIAYFFVGTNSQQMFSDVRRMEFLCFKFYCVKNVQILCMNFCRILCRTSLLEQKIILCGFEFPTFVAIDTPQDSSHQIYSTLLET